MQVRVSPNERREVAAEMTRAIRGIYGIRRLRGSVSPRQLAAALRFDAGVVVRTARRLDRVHAPPGAAYGKALIESCLGDLANGLRVMADDLEAGDQHGVARDRRAIHAVERGCLAGERKLAAAGFELGGRLP
jgi:hypothetical protein